MTSFILLGLLLLGGVGYIASWFMFFRVASAKIKIQGALSFFLLVGLVLPFVGACVGWWYLLVGPTSSRTSQNINNSLRSASDEDIVDVIDQSANASVIAVNSGWLKTNWHNMSDSQKIEWVRQRRMHLEKYLPEAQDAPSFIDALQRADKKFTRGEAA